ncbi:unnamed protein product [Mytilus edulis]|uniref:Uncharacterized protein n=1 Tax=Mytilus edulis TaxID=6550 RepID=A0A8S3TN87_MYTED|nr:unnamed protein product [Mytilus edulis]
MLSVGFSSIVLMIPLSVSLICICLKYELSCKKREHVIVFPGSPSETAHQSQPGVSHQYDEVDDGFLNRSSLIKDEKDLSGSESSTVRSGICGTDSAGYLNPYHTILSKEIALLQGPYSELSDTATSCSLAQGVIKQGLEDDVFLNRKSSKHAVQNVRCYESPRTGSGICGTDNEGYLHPYHALQCTEITLAQGPYFKLSDTETDV